MCSWQRLVSVQNNSSLRTPLAPQIVPSDGSQSDDECHFLAIDPAHVRNIWPFAKDHIARAFDEEIGDCTFAGTEIDVLTGQALLWVAWMHGAIVAAFTTALVKTPKHKVCLITACGGSQIDSWLHFLSQIEAYASAERCDIVRVMGRRGWKRKLVDYHEPWIVLDKSLKT